MDIAAVRVACFSPTGTTRSVAQRLATAICPDRIEMIDLTRPVVRKQPLRTSANDVLVIAVPVYMGRVPDVLSEWINALQAHDTPTVCVVVYGNRVYDNALLELKQAMTGRGAIPIAAAAFIGEHSFSSEEMPVAHGRPDADDLDLADSFGRRIAEKLHAAASAHDAGTVTVPGSYPYGGVTKLWDVDFIEVTSACRQCGVCAQVCPVEAIDTAASARIDPVTCITCCACIKSCPEGARIVKPSPVLDAAKRLSTLFRDPKVPECFLA